MHGNNTSVDGAAGVLEQSLSLRGPVRALVLLLFVTAACTPQEAAAPVPEVTNYVAPLPSVAAAAASGTPRPIPTATPTPSATPVTSAPIATRTPPPVTVTTPPPTPSPTPKPTPNVFIDESQTYPAYDGSQVDIRGVIVNKGPALTGVWLEGLIYDGPNGKVIATGRADIGALGAGTSQKFDVVMRNILGLRRVWYQLIIHWA